MCTHSYPNGKSAVTITDIPGTSTRGDFHAICKLCGEEVSSAVFDDW